VGRSEVCPEFPEETDGGGGGSERVPPLRSPLRMLSRRIWKKGEV